MPESTSTSEPEGTDDAVFTEIVDRTLNSIRTGIIQDIDAALTMIQGNIDVTRAALADSMSREDLFAHICVSSTRDVVQGLTDLFRTTGGRVSNDDLSDVILGFTSVFAALIIAVAESGLDLSQYRNGSPETSGGDSR